MSLRQTTLATTRVTAQESVRSTLRDAILNGTLNSGTQLIQKEVAKDLGVSITPVREALRDLAAEGLVSSSPNRGTFVRSLDLNDVREIYDLRIALEPLMVHRTIKVVTEADLDNARTINSEMIKTHDLQRWARLNRDFHAIFGEDPDESELAGILSRLRSKSELYVFLSLQAHPERVDESNKEHSLLLDLYRSRDVNAIINLTVQHLQSTMDLISDAYGKH